MSYKGYEDSYILVVKTMENDRIQIALAYFPLGAADIVTASWILSSAVAEPYRLGLPDFVNSVEGLSGVWKTLDGEMWRSERTFFFKSEKEYPATLAAVKILYPEKG